MKKKVLTTLLLVVLSGTMLIGCSKEEGNVAASSDFESSELTSTSADVPTSEISGIVELEFANSELKFVYGNEGVIITRLNNLFGATDYSGNVILENKYPYYYQSPSAEGYFILGDDEKDCVFDKQGELVHSVSVSNDITVNEHIVSYAEPISDSDYAFRFYDLEKKSFIELDDNGYLTDGHALYTSSCVDGKLYVKLQEGINIVDVVNKKWESLTDVTEVQSLDAAYNLSYSATPIDGYGTVIGGGTSVELCGAYTESGKTEEWNCPYVIGLLNTEPQQGVNFDGVSIDKNEKKLVSLEKLCEQLGIAWSGSTDWNLIDYTKNGVRYYNKEQLIALQLSDGNITKYCLLDFGKATLDKYSLVTNVEDIIVFAGDYVRLSMADHFLAAQGDDYFYIDANGKKVFDFDDCSNFMNGYTAIKEDGMVYIVDTDFNKVSEGYPADRGYATGDFFGIVTGDQTTYLRYVK